MIYNNTMDDSVEDALQPAVDWPEFLTLCLENRHFSALDVVRLSFTSKAVRCFLIKQLASGDRTIARVLLQREVACASTATADKQKQHLKGVQYLLHLADIPPEMVQLDSRDLVMTSQVPVQLKMLLTAAGVTPTYEQVATAAKQGVRGCEEWVVAHCAACRQRDVPTGVSVIVEVVCAGAEVENTVQLQQHIDIMRPGLTSKSIVGLLHISLNACSKRHILNFNYLLGAPELLMPAAVAELLKAAMKLFCDTKNDYSVAVRYLIQLARSHEVWSMSPSEVFSIIQSTICIMSRVQCKDLSQQRDAGFCMHFASFLPAAQQFCGAEVCSLLCLALRKLTKAAQAPKGYDKISGASGLLEDCLGHLLRLPGAWCMDQAAIDSLLVEAAEWEVYHSKAARQFINELLVDGPDWLPSLQQVY